MLLFLLIFELYRIGRPDRIRTKLEPYGKHVGPARPDAVPARPDFYRKSIIFRNPFKSVPFGENRYR